MLSYSVLYCQNNCGRLCGVRGKKSEKPRHKRIFATRFSASKTACRGFEPFCPCHWKSLETAGFQGFSFALSRTAHGLFCRILMIENGADFPSGGIRSQRFRLLHHQNSIKILAPTAFQPELFFGFCGINFAHLSNRSGGHFHLHLKAFGDSVQPCRIFLDIVKFGDLRGAVPQEVGYLPG